MDRSVDGELVPGDPARVTLVAIAGDGSRADACDAPRSWADMLCALRFAAATGERRALEVAEESVIFAAELGSRSAPGA